jgi:hypothetical protein
MSAKAYSSVLAVLAVSLDPFDPSIPLDSFGPPLPSEPFVAPVSSIAAFPLVPAISMPSTWEG